MAKIRKDEKREAPALSTSSLPDIIFMLLFFFMAVTTMKEVTMKVRVVNPTATEIQKLENKSLVRYVYVGKPTDEFKKSFGSETRIQLGDAFADVSELENFIVRERSSMKEEDAVDASAGTVTASESPQPKPSESSGSSSTTT